MCGIISYFSNETKYSRALSQVISNALWIDSIRGDNSTGIIYGTEEGPEWYKKAMAGWDFVQLDYVQSVLSDLNNVPYFIGHNRAATKGKVNTANAHPFEHGDIIGVHNGTVLNQHALSKGNHQVDSDALFAGISEDGASIVLPKVNGAFNLLWHDKADNTIHVCRNSERPYTFAKIKDHEALIGMSEGPMLQWLVGKFGLEVEYTWQPKANREYVFDVDGDMVKPVRKLDHAEYTAPIVRNYNYNSNYDKNYPIVYGQGGTVRSLISKTIEFLTDTITLDSFLLKGEKVGTWHGEAEDGEDIVIRNVPEEELESGEWYEGMAEWVSDRWVVQLSSVKLSPLYYSGTTEHEETTFCDTCGMDFEEKDIVKVGKEELCLSCCVTHSVEAYEVDRDQRYKLN